MIDKARESIVYVTNVFASPQETFIKVFGAYKIPHLMPLFVKNKVVMQEVGYHICTGLFGSLQKSKKSPWHIFPMKIISYNLKRFKAIEAKLHS